MSKNIILLVAVLLVSFSCKKNTNISFKGKWVNTKNNSEIIIISKIGNDYTVTMDDTKKYPALKNDEVLNIIIDKDTIKAIIDNDQYLIINNESFKKKNKRYRNPGAGVY